MNNTRFATAIHILSLLATKPDEWLTSDYIAGSVNLNPVIIRKEISFLKLGKLIESRKGKEGGVRLAKLSENILLSEIFEIVKNSDILGKKNKNPNPECSIGREINSNLSQLYAETDLVVSSFLKTKNLKEFIEQF